MHNQAGKEGRKRLLGRAQMVTLCAGDNMDRFPCWVSLTIAELELLEQAGGIVTAYKSYTLRKNSRSIRDGS